MSHLLQQSLTLPFKLMIISVNRGYFREQHERVDLCNGEELCFLCGTD
jgi:hypothetical protein